MTITREQVERAMDAAYDCNTQGVRAALGAEWYKDPRIPSDVLAGWRETGYTSLCRALTRWRDELAAAEPIDDTAPERLRERRERADAAQAARMQRDAADYAAALSAEEERRGAQLLADEEARAEAFHAEPERVVTGPLSAGRDRAIQVTHLTSGYIHADGLPWADWQIEPAAPPAPDVVDVPQPDPLAYADSPAWDDGPMPKPERAPEVVDVPQPAPLPKTVAHFYTIRALPEPHRVSWNMPGDGPQWVRVNDALWLHVDDLRAMLADIDAQQPAPVQPARPEPRYKVGDWVSLTRDRNHVWCVTRLDWLNDHWSCGNASGGGVSEKLLLPALDPALHETARRAIAILRKGEWPLDVPRVEDLPGFDEWNSGGMRSPSWAAQLERLLGDAP